MLLNLTLPVRSHFILARNVVAAILLHDHSNNLIVVIFLNNLKLDTGALLTITGNRGTLLGTKQQINSQQKWKKCIHHYAQFRHLLSAIIRQAKTVHVVVKSVFIFVKTYCHCSALELFFWLYNELTVNDRQNVVWTLTTHITLIFKTHSVKNYSPPFPDSICWSWSIENGFLTRYLNNMNIAIVRAGAKTITSCPRPYHTKPYYKTYLVSHLNIYQSLGNVVAILMTSKPWMKSTEWNKYMSLLWRTQTFFCYHRIEWAD